MLSLVFCIPSRIPPRLLLSPRDHPRRLPVPPVTHIRAHLPLSWVQVSSPFETTCCPRVVLTQVCVASLSRPCAYKAPGRRPCEQLFTLSGSRLWCAVLAVAVAVVADTEPYYHQWMFHYFGTPTKTGTVMTPEGFLRVLASSGVKGPVSQSDFLQMFGGMV